MFALLMVPILVSGFILLTNIRQQAYKLHLYDGQFLYIKSAYYGLLCFSAAFLLAYTLKLATLSKVPIITLIAEHFIFSANL